jgi:hypothetical protein
VSTFIRLTDYKSSDEKEQGFFKPENRHTANQKDFEKVPGSPIAYWVSKRVRDIFDCNKIRDFTISDGQTKTGDNDKYIRNIWEVNKNQIGINKKWMFHPKGGEFRKWYGNVEHLINWSIEARTHYRSDHVARIIPEYLWYKKGICWTLITSSEQSFRYVDEKSIFNLAAPTIFLKDEKNLNFILSLLNTQFVKYLLKMMNPTLNSNVGDIQNLPMIFPSLETTKQKIDELTQQCINLSKEDWDSREISGDYTKNELIKMSSGRGLINQTHAQTHATNSTAHDPIKTSYQNYCNYWKEKFYQLHRNEEELNRLFIDIYELQDELTPDVELKDITILKEETFINENNQLEFEKDKVIKQFISYAVGCMFGRYSPDKDGLILANQGETFQDFISKLGLMNQTPTFMPIEDNVIPILDDEYFKNDIVNQFKTFLKVTFGEENYNENLKFVEDAIGKDIRSYFLKDFYEEHIRRYKKRPIYWLFSSEKGAFSALIYMHRYKNDTASIVVNDYLREYISKLQSKRESLKLISLSESVSPADKKKADKDIGIIDKKLKELSDYEQKLLHIANQKIDIDLDDGVKVNYSKFKDVLYKIKGLEKEE